MAINVDLPRTLDMDRVYPWASETPAVYGDLAANPPSPRLRKLRRLFQTGCQWNLTVAWDADPTSNGFMTYAGFIGLINSFHNIDDFYVLGGHRWNVIGRLAGRNNWHNRHLRVCPQAVVLALKWTAVWFMVLAEHRVMDTTLYNIAWHEVRHSQKALKAIDDAVGTYVPMFDKAAVWYEADAILDRYTIQQVNFLKATEPPKAHSWTGNYTSKDHFELVRDAAGLLERVVADNLLTSWVISHGTLVAALRYGASRSLQMPSGLVETEAAKNFDVDIYVMGPETPDAWVSFVSGITNVAKKEFGFSWCGQMEGWVEHSLVCWRGEGEVEIHLVERFMRGRANDEPILSHRLLMAAQPIAKCLVEPPSGVEDAAVELRCPGDIASWFRYHWPHQPQYLECLPLPMGRVRGTFEKLSEEDVRFLWKRSLELRARGYQSMANLFATCQGDDPMAGFARSLYWDGHFEDMFERQGSVVVRRKGTDVQKFDGISWNQVKGASPS